jgi:hypothetical protein
MAGDARAAAEQKSHGDCQPVIWSESDDVYFFETDFGVKYKIYFGSDAPILVYRHWYYGTSRNVLHQWI